MKHIRTCIILGFAGISILIFSLNVSRADETVTGSVVISDSGMVNPLPEIGISVGSVSAPGTLTVRREVASTLPANWDFGSPAYIYRVTTDAAVSGPFFVCISFTQERFVVPNGEIRLIQIDENVATDFTQTYGWTYACGHTDHLSSFAAAQQFGIASTTFSRDSFGRTNVAQHSARAATSFATTPHGASAHFFSAPGTAVLTIANGSTPTTGAHILLNGAVVGTGSLFKKNQNNLSVPVLLLAGQNVLEVFVNGGPESFFTLSIQREM